MSQAPPTLRPVTPVGILSAKLSRLTETLASGGDVSALAHECEALCGGLDRYIEDVTTPASADLLHLDSVTKAQDWAAQFGDGATVKALESEMLSGHIEGQALKMLVQLTSAKRVLEVGLFTGYSALAMAEGLPEDGMLLGLEIDPFAANIARECFAKSEAGRKITIVVGPALESIKALVASEAAPFDLVFIDADKGGYWDYYDTIISSGLLAENGLICIDNTLLQGQPYLPEECRDINGAAIADFNRRLADDLRVEQVLLPLRDGLTLVRVK